MMKNKLIDQKTFQSKVNHITVHEQIEYIENLFNGSGVRVSPLQNLFKLLNEVKNDFTEYNTEATMIKALYVSRIVDAIKCLECVENRKKYLKDLLKGSLDFLEHKPSHAKSIFFELEVFTQVKLAFNESYLDEPDIVVTMEKANIGIACKKITSEKSLQQALSKAVKQINGNSFEFGIVAINIDDLLPEHKILNVETFSNALEILYKHNQDFIARYEHHFRKYLNESRIVAVIVTTSIFTDVKLETPRFNNAFQWTIWTIPEINEKHKQIMNDFRKLVE